MFRYIRENNFLILLIRIAVLYVLWGLCRVVFGIYNINLIGAIDSSDLWNIFKGSFVYDTVSILYLNTPFIVISLLPFRIREKRWYGTILIALYVGVNAVGIMVNMADVCYFPFKLSRIAADDTHFAFESNFMSLLLLFAIHYWGVLLFWIGAVCTLIFTAKIFRYVPWRYRKVNNTVFYVGQSLLFLLCSLYIVWGIRGFVALKGTFPISMSDATMFVKPEHSQLILSNPYCLLRTMGKSSPELMYMTDEEAHSVNPLTITLADTAKVSLNTTPNVVFLILESFGSSHISILNEQLKEDNICYTPNINAILEESYLFTNAYCNGIRSMDALPSILASIPSFKIEFLALPQSVSRYYALPNILKDEKGYKTLFLHGGARESMCFLSFGKSIGIDQFYFRGDYEKKNGSKDFDGAWGIYDDKFLPYALGVLNQTAQPFCATMFTLSSHHPYSIPQSMEARFKDIEGDFECSVVYADYALGKFFADARREPWFDNTLFVLVADHAGLSTTPKYNTSPYLNSIPIAFYMPSTNLKGRDSRPVQQIDIAPTVARMLGYTKDMFGFGEDMFNSTEEPFAIFYKNSTFNLVADSVLYQSDDKQLRSVTDLRTGNAVTTLTAADSLRLQKKRALVQQYYGRISKSDFITMKPVEKKIIEEQEPVQEEVKSKRRREVVKDLSTELDNIEKEISDILRKNEKSEGVRQESTEKAN